MGMMDKIKSAFRKPGEEEAAPEVKTAPADLTAGRRLAESVLPREPVAIDIADTAPMRVSPPASPEDSALGLTVDAESDEITEEKRLSAKKAKQELITELQKNYKEVLELVRRVQAHLDLQDERSEKLMRIVERVPSALEQLPEHRAQNERLIGVVERLSEVSQSSHSLSQQSVRELAKANEQLKQAAHADRELIDGMGQFRDTVDGMAEHHSRSAVAVEKLASRVDQREEELSAAIADGRKWLIVAVAACAGTATVAVTLAIVALLK